MFDKLFNIFSDKEGLEEKLKEKDSVIGQYFTLTNKLKNEYLELKKRSSIYESASILFNEILSSMNSGVILLKPNHTDTTKPSVIYVNKFILKLFDLTKGDIENNSSIIFSYLDKENYSKLIEKINIILEGKEEFFYTNIIIKNFSNNRKLLNVNGRISNYKNQKCIVLTINDLTSEEDYKIKSNLFNSLFIASSLGAMIVDIDEIRKWVNNNRIGIQSNINFIEFNLLNIKNLLDNITIKSANRAILDVIQNNGINQRVFCEKLFYINKKAITLLILNIFNGKEEFDIDFYYENPKGIQRLIKTKFIIPSECYKKNNFNQVLVITKNYDINEDFSNNVVNNDNLIQWREDSEGKVFSANKIALETFFEVNNLNEITNISHLDSFKTVKEYGKPCRFLFRKKVQDTHYWFDLWTTPMFNVKDVFIGTINVIFTKIEENEEFLKRLSETDYDENIRINDHLYLLKQN